MRVEYIPKEPQLAKEEDQAIVERVKQRRGEKGLILLDRALLHAPPVADGWNSFLGSIRSRTSLSTSIRETAICRVAVLNKAWYEWESHAPLLRSGEGVTSEHVAAVLESEPHQVKDGILDDKHAAVLQYTDAMTLTVQVPDDIFRKMQGIFSEKEIVEITATIGAYNCVSRFLVALDVGERNAQTGPNAAGQE